MESFDLDQLEDQDRLIALCDEYPSPDALADALSVSRRKGKSLWNKAQAIILKRDAVFTEPNELGEQILSTASLIHAKIRDLVPEFDDAKELRNLLKDTVQLGLLLTGLPTSRTAHTEETNLSDEEMIRRSKDLEAKMLLIAERNGLQLLRSRSSTTRIEPSIRQPLRDSPRKERVSGDED